MINDPKNKVFPKAPFNSDSKEIDSSLKNKPLRREDNSPNGRSKSYKEYLRMKNKRKQFANSSSGNSPSLSQNNNQSNLSLKKNVNVNENIVENPSLNNNQQGNVNNTYRRSYAKKNIPNSDKLGENNNINRSNVNRSSSRLSYNDRVSNSQFRNVYNSPSSQNNSSFPENARVSENARVAENTRVQNYPSNDQYYKQRSNTNQRQMGGATQNPYKPIPRSNSLISLKKSNNFRNVKFIIRVVSVLFLISFIFTVYYVYNFGLAPKGIDVPEISSSTLKLKPSDPGGLEIQHLDKLVYGELNRNKNSKIIGSDLDGHLEDTSRGERILLEESNKIRQLNKIKPEKKIIKDNAQIINKVDIDKYPTDPYIDVDLSIPKVNKLKKHSFKEANNSNDNNDLDNNFGFVKEKGKTKKTKISVLNSIRDDSYTMGGKWKVQLASFKSKDLASKGWNNFVSKYSVLTKTQRILEEAIINGSVFYRLQASGFANKNEATRACREISSLGGSCIVKSP